VNEKTPESGAAIITELTDLMSIGDLSEITGISPDTIRVWEKRYGRPAPTRLPSGHRRYTQDDARWLRRIAEALAMGYRPSRVVRLGDTDLDLLLFPAADKWEDVEQVRRILDMVIEFKESQLTTELQGMLKRQGPRDFLVDVITPLLDLVGRSWADGQLEIRHEHFLTEILEDFLRSMRLSIERPTKGPRVILATLAGETHSFGLQMVSIICRLCNVPTRILGVHTPIEEIARTAKEVSAGAVALSVSLATGGVETDKAVRRLRLMIPDSIRIAIGGRGARGVRRGPRGIDFFQDLETFESWLRRLESGRAE
jgi:DNA-binding transcriptional MerR regulator/methylmalonyl-CoA mutase cobalamin-binding subunit